MFHEYPKAVYLLKSGQPHIAESVEHEAELRAKYVEMPASAEADELGAQGLTDQPGASRADRDRRRGRPPKSSYFISEQDLNDA